MFGRAVDVRRGRVGPPTPRGRWRRPRRRLSNRPSAGDDLELGRSPSTLGVDGVADRTSSGVGLRHRGQQLLSSGRRTSGLLLVTEAATVDSANLSAISTTGDSPASLIGLTCEVDVTVVGSGPNGLAAAVHLRKGRSFGAVFRGSAHSGRRGAHPGRSRVLRGGARHLFGRASARPGVAVSGGVRSACAWGDAEVPEVAYANPLTAVPPPWAFTKPRPHLRRTDRRRVLAPSAGSDG